MYDLSICFFIWWKNELVELDDWKLSGKIIWRSRKYVAWDIQFRFRARGIMLLGVNQKILTLLLDSTIVKSSQPPSHVLTVILPWVLQFRQLSLYIKFWLFVKFVSLSCLFMLELNSFCNPKRYICSSYSGYEINFVPYWIILCMLISFKVAKGREDAFFASTYNGGVIVVTDGVSGYNIPSFVMLSIFGAQNFKFVNSKHFPQLHTTIWFSIHDPSCGRWDEKDVDPTQFSRE